MKKHKKLVYKILIGLLLILITGIDLFFSQENDWLKKNNIYANLGTDRLPSIDVINELPLNVFIWGPANEDMINRAHELGRKYVPGFMPLGALLMSSVEWIKNTWGIDLVAGYPCINVAGNPVPFEDPLGIGEKMVTICRPLFRQKYIGVLRKYIDEIYSPINPDGIQIDEISSYATNLDANMDDNTMIDFRKFLKQRYTSGELKNKFGIENINNFNYRNYLASQGIYSAFLDPNQELRDEFRKFLQLSTKEDIGNLINYMRGKMPNIYISGNVYSLWPEQHAFISYLDFLTFENSFFTKRLGGWVGKEDFKFFGLYKLGKAFGKPIISVPDVFNFGDLLDKNDYSYYRLFLSEAFAMKENFLIPFDALATGGRQYTIDSNIISPYTNFIKKFHSQFYKGGKGRRFNPSFIDNNKEIKEWTEIGVLYDWYRAFKDLDSHYYFLKTTTALQEGQWLFDVIYIGDSEILNIMPSFQEIKDLKAIIIPYSPFSLSARAQNLLNQYRTKGGKIIYLNKDDSKSNILSKISSLGLDKKVDIGNRRNISISTYSINQNKIDIIFVNYNYDWNQKDFLKEYSIEVSIKMLKEAKRVYYFTPEENFSHEISFSQDNGTLRFVLPELYILCLVNIEF